MKRILTATLATFVLVCLAATSARADLLWYEGFNYTTGPIVNNSGGLWIRHSGTASPSDSIVNNNRLEISATAGSVSRQDDVHRNFTTFTNTQTVLYSSLTVACTNLPPTVGTYIAHFYVNTTTFHGRVFAQAGVLPNTWRLGISGANNVVSRVFPVDLATNVNYQVVVQWDPVSTFSATLWVSPISSSDPSVASSDVVTTPAASLGYGFRQAGTFGSAFFTVTNLAVATTFDEAATNVWNTNAVSPAVLYQPIGGTNFPGENINITSVSAGQGLGSLTYQWRKEGTNVTNPNGNTNVYSIFNAAVSDSGNYDVVVTTPFSLSVTSGVANLWVTNAPIPPIITVQPQRTNNIFYHQTAALHITAIGPPTLSYAWFYNNGPLGPNVSGDGTPDLTITDVFTNNGTAGTYRCDVTNPNGTTVSSNAIVNAVAAPAVSIAFLRTLVDPSTYLATNSNLRWQATGTVTTFTNLTSANTSSYYLQDGTAGINIFVTLGSTFRPAQGDVVTFVGWLSSFNSTLELEADASDASTSYTILSNNIATLPTPKIIDFSITNNLAFCETNLEGSIVMLRNVYFGTNAGNTISTNANTTIIVSNANGDTLNLFFSPQDLDTAAQTLPSFAVSVVGPFTQALNNTATPRNAGYSVSVTRFSDMVTNPITAGISLNNGAALTWPAAPVSYPYRVLSSTNLLGPWSVQVTGLRFTDPNGAYTDPVTNRPAKFYRISTP